MKTFFCLLIVVIIIAALASPAVQAKIAERVATYQQYKADNAPKRNPKNFPANDDRVFYTLKDGSGTEHRWVQNVWGDEASGGVFVTYQNIDTSIIQHIPLSQWRDQATRVWFDDKP